MQLREFEISNRTLIYKTKKEKAHIHFDEILKIILVLAPPAYSKRVDFLYFGKYHYFSVFTTNNTCINVSCLVFDKVEEFFPKHLITRKKKAFPFIVPCELNGIK